MLFCSRVITKMASWYVIHCIKQNKEKNIDMTYEEILENIKMRDYNDSHKEVGSLTRTDEQIYIDSTNLTIPEVVKIITDIVKGDE